MTLKWRNVPIPEAYVLALIAGGALQYLVPWEITTAPGSIRTGGALLLVAGLALAGWCVATAGDAIMDKATLLLTMGPYRFSRNPMYLAWTLMALGVGLLANSVWLLGVTPLALLYLHLVEIPREEARLDEAFGEEYRGYRKRVRRYL